MIHIKLPFKTPTINHLYYHLPKTGIKVLTTQAREIRKQIDEIIFSCQDVLHADLYDKIPLSVDIFICENWLCKDGSVKKKDIANREKFLIDSIFKALKLDDKYIFELFIKKIQSDTEEYSVIQIKGYNEQETD